MPGFEYKVIPAPTKGRKAKGIRGTEMRFAFALQEVMNDLAADGWEYLRTDTLPCEERQGLGRRSTVFQNMLVFRRQKEQAAASDPAKAPEIRIEEPAVTRIVASRDEDPSEGREAWRRKLRLGSAERKPSVALNTTADPASASTEKLAGDS